MGTEIRIEKFSLRAGYGKFGSPYASSIGVNNHSKIIDDSKFTSSCGQLTSFTYFSLSSEIVVDPSCPSPPDTSSPCRTLIVPTDEARVVGGTPAEYAYRFIIIGPGNCTLITTGIIEVNCSGKVQIVAPNSLSSSLVVYLQGTGKKPYKLNNFSTDTPNCDIQSVQAMIPLTQGLS